MWRCRSECVSSTCFVLQASRPHTCHHRQAMCDPFFSTRDILLGPPLHAETSADVAWTNCEQACKACIERAIRLLRSDYQQLAPRPTDAALLMLQHLARCSDAQLATKPVTRQCMRAASLYVLWTEPIRADMHCDPQVAEYNRAVCRRVLPIVMPRHFMDGLQSPDKLLTMTALLMECWRGDLPNVHDRDEVCARDVPEGGGGAQRRCRLRADTSTSAQTPNRHPPTDPPQ